MGLEELKTTPTVDLINYLSEALKRGDTSIANIYAYELACRVYVPNQEISFDKLLEDFGYTKIEKTKTR